MIQRICGRFIALVAAFFDAGFNRGAYRPIVYFSRGKKVLRWCRTAARFSLFQRVAVVDAMAIAPIAVAVPKKATEIRKKLDKKIGMRIRSCSLT